MNAYDVFKAAMALTDNLDENGSCGEVEYSTRNNLKSFKPNEDVEEYYHKTLSILNLIKNELYKYSDTYKIKEDGKRPICTLITDWTTDIDLDDWCTQTMMPLGLAAKLMVDEDVTNANYCQQEYERLLYELKNQVIPSNGSQGVIDVYSYPGSAYLNDNGSFFPHNNGAEWSTGF